MKKYSALVLLGTILTVAANSEFTMYQTCDMIAGDPKTTNCSSASITWSDDYYRCVGHDGASATCRDLDDWRKTYSISGTSCSAEVLILTNDPMPVATECGESWEFVRLATEYNLDSIYNHSYIVWGPTTTSFVNATGCIEVDL